MLQSNYLRALLTPTSVALVGASGKPGSVGRIALENMLGGDFRGELYAVNPAHRRVLGQRSYPSLIAIGKPIDLAVVAAPFASVPGIVADAARAGVRAALVLSAPPTAESEARRWKSALLKTATQQRVRILGPHSFGLIRTDIGLNATLGTSAAHAGKLALVAQSGAMCASMLDFAATAGIGFSAVVALGDAFDIGFGELLDALALDSDTRGILLYVETVTDARRFLSALRAAARTKPVVVLKAGRSRESPSPEGPSRDVVFDAAMRRAGAVRVKTYAQLFSVARVLGMHRAAHGDRLAIVTNGHGPGLLAADIAADRGVTLAELSPATKEALARALAPHVPCGNPVDIRGDASPARLAASVDAVLRDPNVDAALVLHVPQANVGATDTARAVANVARRATKPLLSVWLGAVNRPEAADALEAGGIANFYTPEHAVEAFSFLAAYRRHQQWLLEVPSPQPEPQPPELRPLERIRILAASEQRRELTAMETHTLLSTFGLPVVATVSVDTLAEARAAARRLGYPVTMRVDAIESARRAASPVVELLRDSRMLARAWGRLFVTPAATQRNAGVLIRKGHTLGAFVDLAVGVAADPVFGPVITLGHGAAQAANGDDSTVLLPPLNLALARDFVRGMRAAVVLNDLDATSDGAGRLATILVQVSALVCALPWVRSITLDPVRFGAEHSEILGARVKIDPQGAPSGHGYAHMAIHPYPIELIADVRLPDGTNVHVRPIRPEDAELERAFVAGTSEETRYFRFFYQLHDLTPSMLARFTQVDYDREMALVAIDDADGAPAFAGIARYVMSADRESAEFAVVVTDAWQRRGVARVLMQRLIGSAKARGLKRLEGAVLRANHKMLKFSESLGFVVRDNPTDRDQVLVVLEPNGFESVTG